MPRCTSSAPGPANVARWRPPCPRREGSDREIHDFVVAGGATRRRRGAAVTDLGDRAVTTLSSRCFCIEKHGARSCARGGRNLRWPVASRPGFEDQVGKWAGSRIDFALLEIDFVRSRESRHCFEPRNASRPSRSTFPWSAPPISVRFHVGRGAAWTIEFSMLRGDGIRLRSMNTIRYCGTIDRGSESTESTHIAPAAMALPRGGQSSRVLDGYQFAHRHAIVC